MKFDIFYPIIPDKVNQPFGVNGAYYQQNGINIKGHNGVDFGAYHGQPVYATHDGNAYYEVDERGGCGVVIRTNQVFDYDGDPRYSQVYFKTIYWHLCDGTKEPKFASPIKATDVNGVGQPVKAGDLIGYADTTGFSTGDHLHFGLKPIVEGDTPGGFINPEQNNGYLGAIDPEPYFNRYYAVDAQTVITNLLNQVSLLRKIISVFKSLFDKSS